MSLYNLLHGFDPNASLILDALGISPSQIERFRDASFTKDGDAHVIDVLCRTGGGNRPDFPNFALTSHALYLRDVDDDHDSTYAHYYFRVPPRVLAELAAQGLTLDDVVDPRTFGEKSEAAMETLKHRPILPPKKSP